MDWAVLIAEIHMSDIITQVNLVNMVRDPVERVISWYYYVRAPWYFVERKRAFPELPLPNPNWLKKVKIILQPLDRIEM